MQDEQGDHTAPPPPHAGTVGPVDHGGRLELMFNARANMPVTWLLLGANVLVFCTGVYAGLDWLHPTAESLRAQGGNYAPWTTLGQQWRLLTSIFVHGGIIHLVLTSLSLWSVGRFVERLLGHVATLIVYLGSGICGALVSTVWNPHVTSVGSSGAIFGLLGSLLGFLLRNRARVRKSGLGPLAWNVTAIVVLNLALGLALPHVVDNAAHIGGLLAGGALGLIFVDRPGMTQRSRVQHRLLAAGLCSAVIVPAILSLPRFPDVPHELESTYALEERTHARAMDLLHSAFAGAADPRISRLEITLQVIEPLERERVRLTTLPHIPEFYRPYRDAAVRALDQRLTLYREMRDALDRAARTEAGPRLQPFRHVFTE